MAKVVITREDNENIGTYNVSAKYEPELVDDKEPLTKAQAMAEILLPHAVKIMILKCDIYELLSRVK